MDWLFEFGEDEIPTAVVLATGALILLFAIGIPLRLVFGIF